MSPILSWRIPGEFKASWDRCCNPCSMSAAGPALPEDRFFSACCSVVMSKVHSSEVRVRMWLKINITAIQFVLTWLQDEPGITLLIEVHLKDLLSLALTLVTFSFHPVPPSYTSHKHTTTTTTILFLGDISMSPWHWSGTLKQKTAIWTGSQTRRIITLTLVFFFFCCTLYTTVPAITIGVQKGVHQLLEGVWHTHTVQKWYIHSWNTRTHPRFLFYPAIALYWHNKVNPRCQACLCLFTPVTIHPSLLPEDRKEGFIWVEI